MFWVAHPIELDPAQAFMIDRGGAVVTSRATLALSAILIGWLLWLVLLKSSTVTLALRFIGAEEERRNAQVGSRCRTD